MLHFCFDQGASKIHQCGFLTPFIILRDLFILVDCYTLYMHSSVDANQKKGRHKRNVSVGGAYQSTREGNKIYEYFLIIGLSPEDSNIEQSLATPHATPTASPMSTPRSKFEEIPAARASMEMIEIPSTDTESLNTNGSHSSTPVESDKKVEESSVEDLHLFKSVNFGETKTNTYQIPRLDIPEESDTPPAPTVPKILYPFLI